MQVFKLCMKVIRKNKMSMLIYVFIFLGIAVVISLASTKAPMYSGFTTAKADVAFFSEEDTPLVSGMKEELGKSANFVNLPDREDALQDALYFRDVTYIVRVPKGFTEKFLRGEDVRLIKTSVPDSTAGAYLDMALDRYLNTAALYVKSGKNLTQEQLAARLKTDLDQNVNLEMISAKTESDTQKPFTAYYFNYFGYIFPAVLIFGVSVLMEVFNDKDLRWRTFCSPMTARTYNSQFLLAVAVFSAACWAVLLLPCAAFDPSHFFTRNTAFQAVNAFVFLLVCAGLSFLIGNLVKNKEAISAAANVFALGPSFISGVFIPQSMLNDNVLKIASFTPTYWYVTANEKLGFMQNFSQANLTPVWNDILMQFGFAAAFIALGLVAGKQRRTGC